MSDFRCGICGRYVSYEELDYGIAKYTPASDPTKHWLTYHIDCVKQKQKKEKKVFDMSRLHKTRESLNATINLKQLPTHQPSQTSNKGPKE